jgi:large subunit ribosomal protein L4
MAIADKIKSDEVVILQNFDFDFSKTKDFAKFCKTNGISSALFVDESANGGFLKIMRNSNGYDFIPQIGLNVYDILRKDRLILTVSAIEKLQERLA